MDNTLTAVQMTPQRFEKCLLRQSINYVVGLGLIVVKKTEMKEGNQPQIVRTTMGQGEDTIKYAVRLSELAITASSLVRDLDPKNDLTFLRVTCKNYDMMIAPDRDYFLIVV